MDRYISIISQHVCVYVYTHTYIHLYIHTHIYMNTLWINAKEIKDYSWIKIIGNLKISQKKLSRMHHRENKVWKLQKRDSAI